MVMEWPIRSAGAVPRMPQRRLAGIPREELLRFSRTAAEALDVISVKHGLQHLDVKPANHVHRLRRVKVGDYAWCARNDREHDGQNRGFTPDMSPRKCSRAAWTTARSVLAPLVYQELLTGTFPTRPARPSR